MQPVERGSVAFRQFPVASLPPPIASFVSEGAAAVGCDPTFLALPVLTLLGAAIGNTRRLLVKSTYEVPPILWTGIVGESGTGKTPALRVALGAAYEHEARLQGEKEPGRFLVGDTTSEALALLMASNARGVLCVRDELAGWLGSIDRYSDNKGRCSADRSFLLSAYNGMPHTVDRRTGEHRHLHIPRASLWVTGGIQPGILARAMGSAERESGLLARLLLACPPAQPLRYSDDDVSVATKSVFDKVVTRLFAIEGQQAVELSSDAKEVWRAFHDRTAEEAVAFGGDLAAAWSKSRDTALRVALILHLCEMDRSPLPPTTMTAAVHLTEWFKAETQRVYRMLAGRTATREESSPEGRLLEWLATRGWVTQRDVERGPRCLRNAPTAEVTLQHLVARGEIEQRHRPAGADGGAPCIEYRLRPLAQPLAPPAVTQPPQARPKEGCVAVTNDLPDEAWTKL